jgi:adenosine deaminase
MQTGLVVTLTSDDPPMFNTTLTEEYLKCAKAFGWDKDTITGLVMTALEVSLLPEPHKSALREQFEAEFYSLA